MADLLPSSPDPNAGEDTEPRVIGLDSDDADELLAAISSETARRLLASLHEEPATPSELSDRVDTSLQNAQYHLEKLGDAGAIQVVDTCYSEKGREMNVFAPADRPLVVFAGDQSEESGLRAALSRLFGGVLAVGIVSAVVQTLFGEGFISPMADDAAPADAGDDADAAPADAEDDEADFDIAADDDATGTPEPETESIELARETPDAAAEAAGTLDALSPGLAFFAGGTLVLVAWFTIWYYKHS